MRPIGNGRVRVAAAFALAATLVLSVACGGAGKDAAPAAGASRPAVSVAVAVVEETAVPVAIEATATVEPLRRVAPGTKILGRIATVPVREGQQVSHGAVLATLESGDLRAAVAQAEAALAMARAQETNAAAMLRRMTELHGRGSATDKNLEDAQAGARVATAGVTQAEAAVEAAEVMLGYATIRTPVAGWVVRRHVEAGDMASPGMPMFVVEDLSKVKVVVEVPESDVVDLEPGVPATIDVPVLAGARDGTVERIVPAGDPRSRTYQVHVVLPNPDGRLNSGMFARARFDRGERAAVVVPTGAVVRRGQLDGVFVVGDDGRARLRWIRLRPVAGDDGRVEVLSGLGVGERYVVQPPAALADGDPVKEA